MNEITKREEKKFEDFYLRLREKINKWVKSGKIYKKTGKWTDNFLQYLLVFPDLVHLMIKLFLDKEISPTIKGYILIAMVYVISPIDIIPDFFPAVGFIDDLLVLVILFNKIVNSDEPKIKKKIKTYWAGEEDVYVKVKEIIGTMNELSSQIPKSIYNFMKKK